MNILEERLEVDVNIEVCNRLLEKLYEEQKRLIKNCNHEIRIIGLEKNEEFQFYKTVDCCLLCGKQFPNRMMVTTQSEKNSVIIVMTNYPKLNKKWGKKYREEVEKIYLSLKRNYPLCSEKELYLKIRYKLGKMEEKCDE